MSKIKSLLAPIFTMHRVFPTRTLTAATFASTLIAASFVHPGRCYAQAEAQPGTASDRIRFTVVIDAPKPITAMLEKGLDLVRWAGDTRVTSELLERLVAEADTAAREALAAEGYFSADVRTRIEAGEPVRVHMSVNPGPRTLVSEIELRFQGAAADGSKPGNERIEAVRRAWLLKKGEPFRQVQWEEAKRKALADLGGGRYAAARIASSEARIDPPSRTARLEVQFDSGPVYSAGALEASGLRRYPARIVENMSPFKAGEPYDEAKIKVFQRRLLESGYFSTARIDIDKNATQPETAPMRVTVVEAPSQRIDTGVSFSTDARIGVQLDYSNANVFDSAWRFHPRLKFDAKTQDAEIPFDSPPQPGGSWNSYTAKLKRTDIENQVTQQASIGVAHNWGLERTPSQLSLSAHREREDVAGFPSETNHAVFLGYRGTFRFTDDPVSPRRGMLGTFQLGTSIPGLTSQDFIRSTIKTTFLMPVGDRADLAVRGEAGVVVADSRQGVPASFLFRTGGDQTVRGYAFESIGVPKGPAIVGGRYLVLGSAEYTYWFAGDWGAAAFIDAGDAFDDRKDLNLAVGYGIGARWRSPIGPFRADLAYGARTGHLRLHFSAGFTF